MVILAAPVKLALLALAACVVTPAAARAGEAACWYENGVVVVTASVAGVVGDYILDTAAPTTQLADTQAQRAGFEAEAAITGEVRLAGARFADRPIQVAYLDVRTGLHPTPIAGVIGADVLQGQVLDLALAPCRIGLWPAGQAPRFPRAQTLPLEPLAGGLQAVRVRVSDGELTREAALALATGSDAPVRLSDSFASAAAREKPEEHYPYGVYRPKLARLSFARGVWKEVPAGLLKAEAGVEGWLGAPILARFRVRIDFAAGQLLLRTVR